MSKIKFGVNIDEAPEMLWHADYNATKNMAQQAEVLGYTSLWVMDHFYWGKGPRALGGEGTVFEPWTVPTPVSFIYSIGKPRKYQSKNWQEPYRFLFKRK